MEEGGGGREHGSRDWHWIEMDEVASVWGEEVMVTPYTIGAESAGEIWVSTPN